MRWAVSLLAGAVAFAIGGLFTGPTDHQLMLALLRHNLHVLELPAAWQAGGSVLLHNPHTYNRIRAWYQALWFGVPWAMTFMVLSGGKVKAGKMPKLSGTELSIVLGEVHEQFSADPSATPTWLTMSKNALYGGLAISGMTGVGKTASAIEPFIEQLIGFVGEQISALFLEVKGNFGEMVTRIATEAGRADDVRVIGDWHYNPLGNPLLSSAELGDVIGRFMSEAKVSGGALEAHFWRHAGTSLNGNAIEVLRLNGEVPTLSKVFRLIGDPEAMQVKLREADDRINGKLYYTFDKVAMRRYVDLMNFSPQLVLDPAFGEKWIAPCTLDLHYYCHPLDNPLSGAKKSSRTRDIKHGRDRVPHGGLNDASLARRLDTLVFDIEKVWESVSEDRWADVALAAAETLKLFEAPGIFEVYCPSPDDPKLLAPMSELMDSGKLVVVKYSAADEKLSQLIATMLKLDYQRSIMGRLEKPKPYRMSLFVCDEYQELAGDRDPAFGAKCREACCMRIVAYPGYDALELFTGKHWRAIAGMCNSRIWLGANDTTTAKEASELCGKRKAWKSNPSMSEQRSSGMGTRGSSTSVSHSEAEEPNFKPDVFINMPIGKGIAFIWDPAKGGRLPPTWLHLKQGSIPAAQRYSESVFAQRAG